ncbi:MAG: sulfite exporter TauE/SafE family protein, partial [Ktedonobacteraceae bacterium]|nr:sulfite exporter TauE/SafE family protein [Ktedonobacteraceae bacterium]
FISVLLVQYVRKHYGHFINGFIIQAIGCVLILVAVLLFFRPYILRFFEKRSLEVQKQDVVSATTATATPWERVYRPFTTILIGAIVGFLVGLTSVGSGTLVIVSIVMLYPKLTAKELVGTDIFQGFMLVASGAIAYFFVGTINWTITGLLLLGSLPGVIIGSQLSKYIPNRFMRPVLAVVLAVSGFKLI